MQTVPELEFRIFFAPKNALMKRRTPIQYIQAVNDLDVDDAVEEFFTANFVPARQEFQARADADADEEAFREVMSSGPPPMLTAYGCTNISWLSACENVPVNYGAWDRERKAAGYSFNNAPTFILGEEYCPKIQVRINILQVELGISL
jgi:hypothetical protein